MVFELLLQPLDALAGSVGAIIGVGDGRGMAAIFVLMGALALLAAVIAIPKLLNLDAELPDAL
jgi:hypothetical protein